MTSEHVVELAICLDTSGSMDGLINSARQKLWTIVNDLAKAEPTPKLRVALLSYGNDGHHAENGWVNVETPFTEDLDTVSQMLFGLTTNGGTELVGRVVQTSLQELDWHPSTGALRMIFVAGNESADQDDQVAVRTICTEAAARGIDVNSIYCEYGDDDSEIKPGWREFAKAGNGEFAMIDQNNGSVVIATPYDQTLIELSARLNKTYIPFGAAGAAGCNNQMAQDDNALQMNTANAASRAATKAGKLYTCAWDLVDAYRTGQIDLADVDEKDLPEDMQTLSHEQRVAKINAMQKQRTTLQNQINELDQHRQALLNKELARQSTTNVGGFDLAIRTAIRTKAEAKGFTFTPFATPIALEMAPVENMESFEYFVQFSGASIDTWVANDLVVEFEKAHLDGRAFVHDHQVVPGTPEATALVESLPKHVRELVRSLKGVLYLHLDDKIYLVTGGC
ncbi:MAG: VWA domain-containing protein [Phycisphaerales bacterium]|nr:VWA domain-containing protein [Phycisphaerales bacterium]